LVQELVRGRKRPPALRLAGARRTHDEHAVSDGKYLQKSQWHGDTIMSGMTAVRDIQIDEAQRDVANHRGKATTATSA
jgi:hypothetical protein